MNTVQTPCKCECHCPANRGEHCELEWEGESHDIFTCEHCLPSPEQAEHVCKFTYPADIGILCLICKKAISYAPVKPEQAEKEDRHGNQCASGNRALWCSRCQRLPYAEKDGSTSSPQESWEKGFKIKFTCLRSNQGDQIENSFKPYTSPDEIIDFIRQTRQQAKEEERERIIEIVKEEHEIAKRMNKHYFDKNKEGNPFYQGQVVSSHTLLNQIIKLSLQGEGKKE